MPANKRRKIQNKKGGRATSSSVRHSRHGLNVFYYGMGKGKTTAAMGLAVRAAGAGMNVLILQFVKSRTKRGRKPQGGEWPVSSEIVYMKEAERLRKGSHSKKIGAITAREVGAGFVGILGDNKNFKVHIAEAKKGLALARAAIASNKYDVIVLDELVSALELELITEQEILDLIRSKPVHLHLVYTGHDPFKSIIDASDLVSELRMEKHPYYKGILAQRGIDF